MLSSSKNPKKKSKKQSKLFVLINCFDGKTKTTMEEVARIYTVTHVKEIEGPYDIITTLESSSNDELKKALQQLRKLKTVRGTLTLRSSDDLEVLG
jgi:hypothetical protein